MGDLFGCVVNLAGILYHLVEVGVVVVVQGECFLRHFCNGFLKYIFFFYLFFFLLLISEYFMRCGL